MIRTYCDVCEREIERGQIVTSIHLYDPLESGSLLATLHAHPVRCARIVREELLDALKRAAVRGTAAA